MALSFGTGGDSYNAFVHAIGSAIGLDPLLSGGDPTGPQLPPPPKQEVSKPEVSPARTEMLRDSMAVRQHYPTPKATAGGRGLGPGGQPGMNMPGVMSPDVLMHPEVQQLLGQYGISPEQLQSTVQGASPDMFITNPAAHVNHPVLSEMIERGLEGAAFTQGSRTWGEGISNVAQGMLNSNAARAEKYNNQLMMPFAQAQQVAGLKGEQIKQQFEQAQAARDDALVKHYGDMDATREELNDIKRTQANIVAQTLRFHQNVGLVQMMKDVALNPEEQAKVDKALQDAGGDPYNVDPVVYIEAHSSALQRKINEEHQSKLNVAKVANSGRITVANIGAGSKSDTDALNAAKEENRTAAQALQAFESEVAKNQFLYTTAEENTKRQALTNAVNESKRKLDAFTTPGSNVQPKKQAKSNNNNPAPVGYHDPASGLTKQADGTWK